MQSLKNTLWVGLLILSGSAAAQKGSEIRPVNFAQVAVKDQFWTPHIKKIAAVTLPVCIEYTENKTGRIRNFERVAGSLDDGKGHEGIYFDDSDVYKALEAIAYALKLEPNPTLEEKADEWIAKIAAAQEPDGYINTYYSLTGLDERWKDMERHEDYCAGHLVEAGVAYYDATGKRDLLDVGIRMVGHMMTIFGPDKRNWVTGHQELELALVKLYQTTGEERYLAFSDWLINERGKGHGKGGIWENEHWGAAYCQDDKPIEELENISGHAVRAMYYYTGVVDVASYKDKPGYMRAMDRVWEDVVHRNTYLTGAIGSSRHNEGFTEAYDLPNASAYGETCASVGMVFWNQRMFQATGTSKYIDVLERSLYNGALAGISLAGDRFFYPNPLASDGDERKEWFGTACCPSNIARLLASLGNYVYAQTDAAIWVNLFVGSQANIQLGNHEVILRQETDYPKDGESKIVIEPKKQHDFALHIRIPGWVKGEAIPGDLYRFGQGPASKPLIKVNGKEVTYQEEQGYAVLKRKWKKGDEVSITMPLEAQAVYPHPSIQQNQDRVAIQRGPLVYCVEGVDNQEEVFNLLLPAVGNFKSVWEPNLLGGITSVEVNGKVAGAAGDGQQVELQDKTVKAIPYFAWANRGKSPMQVWIPTKIHSVTLNKSAE